MFLDSVQVTATLNALAVVPPIASSEVQPYDFQFQVQKLSWENAEEACAAKGRHLASVHSVDESAFIASLHHGCPPDIGHGCSSFATEGSFAGEKEGSYAGMWIGFTDSSCPDTVNECWAWSDGSLNDWTNWYTFRNHQPSSMMLTSSTLLVHSLPQPGLITDRHG